ARPEADVRCAHPRCRRLARLALHRIRTASARRREKRSGRRIRGLYHPISQAISAASFQQSRALTQTATITVQNYELKTLIADPANSSSLVVAQGTVLYSANYIYVADAPSHLKRVLLSSF